MELIGKRKLLAFLITLLAASILLWSDKLDGVFYKDIITTAMYAFFASNAAKAFANNNKDSNNG